MTSVEPFNKGYLPSWLLSIHLIINYLISFTLSSILSLLWFYLKPLVKIGLRKCTGLCELQRICYKTEKGAQRSLEVEKCVYSSRRQIVKMIRDQLDDVTKNGRFNSRHTREVVQLVESAVESICIEKEIKPSIHPEFLTAMRISFLQIYGYKNLQQKVNCLRNIPIDMNNLKHVKRVIKLWNQLNPDNPLQSPKFTGKWTDIGFNNEDPIINFRGIGLLGLDNLFYFSLNHPEIAQRILNRSKYTKSGFPLGSTGVYLTYVTINLLNNGRLKTHFYNCHFGTTCLEDFHKVYCYLFCTLDQLWMMEKPKDGSELSFIKEKLINQLDIELDRNDVILKWVPIPIKSN